MESKKAIRITARDELVIVISVIGLMIISLIVPWIVPRLVLGIPFVMFFPGYSLVSALFPGKGKIDLLERLIIGAGFSLVVVPLLAFVLNFSPWGLRLVPLFVVYSSFTLVASIASYYLNKRLPEEGRFVIEIPTRVPNWNATSRLNKSFSLMLIASILIAIGSIGFAMLNPKPGEKFTELYVLGKEGKAAAYPQTINLGESATVTVGIVNQERRLIPYRLEVTIGDAPTFTKDPIVLDIGQSWEDTVPLSPVKPGKQQKVVINIYRPGDTRPYEFLILWVDVVGKGS